MASAEMSVLWSTIGKGDSDFSIHHFTKLSGHRGTVRCVLPLTPVSYEGRLVSIRWGVRFRLQTVDGGTLIHEVPFDLFSPEPEIVVPAVASSRRRRVRGVRPTAGA